MQILDDVVDKPLGADLQMITVRTQKYKLILAVHFLQPKAILNCSAIVSKFLSYCSNVLVKNFGTGKSF